MNPAMLTILMLFSIPIIALLMGGWKAYLNFQSEQRHLGSSTDALEQRLSVLHDRLDTVEAEREALRKRLENLETIVTAEAWDAVQHTHAGDDAAPPDAADVDMLAPNRAPEPPPPSKQADAIARRLRER
jgi:uncharacterized membrane protein